MIDTNAKDLDLSAAIIVKDCGDIMDITTAWAAEVFPHVYMVVAEENNDNTMDVVEELMGKYSNITAQISPWNGVFGSTFQKAFDMVPTKYMVTVDTDEIFTDFDWKELIDHCEEGNIDSYHFHRLDLAVDLKRYIKKYQQPSGGCVKLSGRPHRFGDNEMHRPMVSKGRTIGKEGPELNRGIIHFTLVRTLIGLFYKGIIRGIYKNDKHLGNLIMSTTKQSPDDHMFVVNHRLNEMNAFLKGAPLQEYAKLPTYMMDTLDRWIPLDHKIRLPLEDQLAELKIEMDKFYAGK